MLRSTSYSPLSWGLGLILGLTDASGVQFTRAGDLSTAGLAMWFKADAIRDQSDNTELNVWVDSRPARRNAAKLTAAGPTYRSGARGPFHSKPYGCFATDKHMGTANLTDTLLVGDLTAAVFTVANAASRGMY